jgi:hypothetical protein
MKFDKVCPPSDIADSNMHMPFFFTFDISIFRDFVEAPKDL